MEGGGSKGWHTGGSGAGKRRVYTIALTQLSGRSIIAGGEGYYLYTTVRLGGKTFCTPIASRPLTDTPNNPHASAVSSSSSAPPLSHGFTVEYPNPTWPYLSQEGNHIAFHWNGSSSAMPDAEFIVWGKHKKAVDEERRALQEKTDAIAKLLESSSDDEEDGSASLSRSSDASGLGALLTHVSSGGHPHRQKARGLERSPNSMAAKLRARSGDPLAQKAATPSAKDVFFGYARVRLDETMLKKSTPVRLGIRGPMDESLLRLHGTLGSLLFTIDYVDESALAPPVLPRDDAVGDETDTDEERELTTEAYVEAERRATERMLSFLGVGGDVDLRETAADRMKVCCALTEAVFFPLDPVLTVSALRRYGEGRRARADAKLARRREKLAALERLDANAKKEWWRRQRAEDRKRRAAEAERQRDATTVEGLVRGCGTLGRLLTVDATLLSLELRATATVSPPQGGRRGAEAGHRPVVRGRAWGQSRFTSCPVERSADPTQRTSYREQQTSRNAYMSQVLHSALQRRPADWLDPHSPLVARTAAFRWNSLDALLQEDDLLGFEAVVRVSVLPEGSPQGGLDPEVLAACPSEALCVARGPLYVRRRTEEAPARTAAVVWEAVVPCFALSGAPSGEEGVGGAEEEAAQEQSGLLRSGDTGVDEFLQTVTQVPAGLTSPTQEQQPRAERKSSRAGDSSSVSADENGGDGGPNGGHEARPMGDLRCSLSVTARPVDLGETVNGRSMMGSTIAPLRRPPEAHHKAPRRRTGERGGGRGRVACKGAPCGWLLLTLTPATAAAASGSAFDVEAYMSKARRFAAEVEPATTPAMAGGALSNSDLREGPIAFDSLMGSGRADPLAATSPVAPAAEFKGRLVHGSSPTTRTSAPFPGGGGEGKGNPPEAGVEGGPRELPSAPPGGLVVSPVAVELASHESNSRRRYVVVALRPTGSPHGTNEEEEEIFTTQPASAVDGRVEFPSCVYMIERCGPVLGPLVFAVHEVDDHGRRRQRCGGRCIFHFSRLPYVGTERFALCPAGAASGEEEERGEGERGRQQQRAAGDGPTHVTLQWNISPEVKQAFFLRFLRSANAQAPFGLPSVAELNAEVSHAERRRRGKPKKGSGGEGETASTDGEGSPSDSAAPSQGPPVGVALWDHRVSPPPPAEPRPPAIPLPVPPPPPASTGAGSGGRAQTPTPPPQTQLSKLQRPHSGPVLSPSRASVCSDGSSGRPLSLSDPNGADVEANREVKEALLVKRRAPAAECELTLRVTVLSAVNLRQPRQGLGSGTEPSASSPSLTIAPYVVLAYESECRDNYSAHLPLVCVRPAPAEAVVWDFAVSFTVPRALAGQPFQLLTFEVRDGNTRRLFGAGALSLATPGVAAPSNRCGGEGEEGDRRECSTASSSPVSAPAVGPGRTEVHVVPLYRRAADPAGLGGGGAARALLQRRASANCEGGGGSDWLLDAVAPCVGELTVLTSITPRHSLLDDLFGSDRREGGEGPSPSVRLFLSVLGGAELRPPPHLCMAALQPYVTVTVEQFLSSREGATDGGEGERVRRRRQRQYRSATAPAFVGTNPLWYMELPPLAVSPSVDDVLTFTVLHAESEGFDVVLGEARVTTRELVEHGLAVKPGGSGGGGGGGGSPAAERHCTPTQLRRLPLSLSAADQSGRTTSAGFLTVEWFMQRDDDDDDEEEDAADHTAHILELGAVRAQGIALPSEVLRALPRADVVAVVFTAESAKGEGGGGFPFTAQPSAHRPPSSSSHLAMVGTLTASEGGGDGDLTVCFPAPESTVPLRLSSRMEPVRMALYARVHHSTGEGDVGTGAADPPVPVSTEAAREEGTPPPFALYFLGEAALQTAALGVCAAAQEPSPVTLSLRPRRDPRYRGRDILRANQSLSGRSPGSGLGGLGFVTLRAALYPLSAFDARVRRQIAQRGIGYTVQVQVCDTADFVDAGAYVVEVKAMGTNEAHRTRPAHGRSLSFQQHSFCFALQRSTELLEFRLLRQRVDPSPATPSAAEPPLTLVAATTLTITGPYHHSPPQPQPQQQRSARAGNGVAPPFAVQSAWLTLVPLTPHSCGHDDAMPRPKLHVRWRIVGTSADGGTSPVAAPQRPASVYGFPAERVQSGSSTGSAPVGRYRLPPGGRTPLSDSSIVGYRTTPEGNEGGGGLLRTSSRVEVLPSSASSAAAAPSLRRPANEESTPRPARATDPLCLTVLYGPTGQLVHFTGNAASSTAQDVMLYCRAVAGGEDGGAPPPRTALYESGGGSDGAQRRRLPLLQPLSEYVKPGAYVQMLEVHEGDSSPSLSSSPAQSASLSPYGSEGRRTPQPWPPSASRATPPSEARSSRGHHTPSGLPSHSPMANGGCGHLCGCADRGMSDQRRMLWLRDSEAARRVSRAVLDELARRAVQAMSAGSGSDAKVSTCALTLLLTTLGSPEVQCILGLVGGRRRGQLRGFWRPCRVSLPEPNATLIAVGRRSSTAAATAAAQGASGECPTRAVGAVEFILQSTPALLYAFLCELKDRRGRLLFPSERSVEAEVEEERQESVLAVVELLTGFVPLFTQDAPKSCHGSLPAALTAEEGRRLLLACLQRQANGRSCVYEEEATLGGVSGGEGVYNVDGRDL